jgi:SET domain-containing protein
VDAQKKGNWARFMNHSCNPNCILQKWVVGNRFRMGIFAKRDIEPGQELTFDYKFERYGDKAQPCFCGESVCTGFIGGSKKTELNDEDDEDEEMYLSEEDDKKKKGKKEKPKEAKPLSTVEDVQKLVKIMLYSSSKPGKIEYCLQTLEVFFLMDLCSS